MKKFLIAAAAFGALSAASAQSVDGTVNINGSVAAKCTFTVNNAVINLGELAAANGQLDAAVVNGRTATLNGWCNGVNSTIAVTSSPIAHTTVATAPTGFSRRVDYTATASLTNAAAAAISASDSSVGALSAGASVVAGLFSAPITVTLSAAASSENAGGIMVAGNYTGLVTVTLTPAL